jgi:2-polyprenyl-6-methoxyphenol hydroxylase-like FAD-dependent oxidoreductase
MSGAEGPLRIAVAGGSIGGLCAGVTLRAAGFDVQVYERVSGPMETRGAGIVVQGELIDLLRTHDAGALPTTRCTVRRYLSPEGGEGEVQRDGMLPTGSALSPSPSCGITTSRSTVPVRLACLRPCTPPRKV